MQKNSIPILIILIFCSVGFALADDGIHDPDETGSAPENVIAEYTIPAENILPLDPDVFRRLSESAYRSYGAVPPKSGESAHGWRKTMESIADAIQEDPEFRQYLPPNSNMTKGYGCHVDGYLIIHLNPDADVTDQIIENMYRVIDGYAKAKGIDDVPVIFSDDPLPTPYPAAVKEPMPPRSGGSFFSPVIAFIKNIFGL